MAVRVPDGLYKDLWELRSDWKDGGVKAEMGVGGDDGEGAGTDAKVEGKEEWDEEDEDEEDDFEEVM
jgi:transcription initiation factor TFIIF subunit beta